MMSDTKEESEHRCAMPSPTSHPPTICSPSPHHSMGTNRTLMEPSSHSGITPKGLNHFDSIPFNSIQFNSIQLTCYHRRPGIHTPSPHPPSTTGSCTGDRIRSGVTLVFCIRHCCVGVVTSDGRHGPDAIPVERAERTR